MIEDVCGSKQLNTRIEFSAIFSPRSQQSCRWFRPPHWSVPSQPSGSVPRAFNTGRSDLPCLSLRLRIGWGLGFRLQEPSKLRFDFPDWRPGRLSSDRNSRSDSASDLSRMLFVTFPSIREMLSLHRLTSGGRPNAGSRTLASYCL